MATNTSIEGGLTKLTFPFRSQSPRETFNAGEAFASSLAPGMIVALYGDLGAGKTEFVRGVCSGLGISENVVTSPTFAIVNEYPEGRIPVFHFDVYRMKSIDELYELGYEDYFFGEGVSLIEWPSMVEELLPPATIRLRISPDGEGRLIELVEV